MDKPLSQNVFLRAFRRLDELIDGLLKREVTLIAGGGGAMILAHHYPLATADLDAIPKAMAPEELDPLVKIIAREQNLPGDWLNPYFSTFTHTLPEDYGDRLQSVFEGDCLRVLA